MFEDVIYIYIASPDASALKKVKQKCAASMEQKPYFLAIELQCTTKDSYAQ